MGGQSPINPVNPLPHKTRFHELAHVLLGHTAEGEQADSERTPRNLRECEAEAVALLCCAALDLPGVEECRGYIQAWWGAGQPDSRAFGPADPEGCRSDPQGWQQKLRREVAVMRAAIYARVSTFDQEPENQLQELRRYVEARGWTAVEYVDRGVSGAKDRRPALDALLRDAKRRRFDVLVCWRLDRLGRNLEHLITLLEELQALGVAFVSLGRGDRRHNTRREAADAHPGAIAEFERERIRERVMAGLQRARSKEATRPTRGSRADRTASRASPGCPVRSPPSA